MEIVPPETALQAAKREEEPCQGLKVHFGVVGCKGGGGKKKKLVRSRKVFPGACIPTRAKATLSTMPGIESSLWRGIRFAKEAVVFRLAKRVTVRAPVALAIVACFLRACFLLSYINNQCLVY